MTKVKESSTIQANKEIVFRECPVTYVTDRIGGRWKPSILFNLLSGSKRYSELKNNIPGITEKMLIQHLKELETDKLIMKDITYSLTASGESLRPVLHAMAEWVVEDSKNNSRAISKNLDNFPL
jgi:DNA-binding HxlR family transcriptional regulator